MSKKLIDYLPSFMQQSELYKSILHAEDAELTSVKTAINDLYLQIDIDTATWALHIYEKDLGIATDYTKPYADRRAVIKSKERGLGKVDTALIKNVADAYVNGDADVYFDGKIQVRFTSTIGIPPNLEDLKLVIDELRPAHLELIYHILYRTYGDLINYTHGGLAIYTHSTLREGDLI